MTDCPQQTQRQSTPVRDAGDAPPACTRRPASSLSRPAGTARPDQIAGRWSPTRTVPQPAPAWSLLVRCPGLRLVFSAALLAGPPPRRCLLTLPRLDRTVLVPAAAAPN